MTINSNKFCFIRKKWKLNHRLNLGIMDKIAAGQAYA
jgi:hypothetical protein